jgi:predicted nuclease of restriction endonuclease-like (RecB) superfamily
MRNVDVDKDYLSFIEEIKQNILQSRYKAASIANREMLLLYYHTGFRLSQKIKEAGWGSGVVRNISEDLQKELPGLRGFSNSNLKNMRQFYEEYSLLLPYLHYLGTEDGLISQSATGLLNTYKKGQSVTGQIKDSEFMQSITAQIENKDTKECITDFIENVFLKIGFTHHIMLISKCKDYKERTFYYQKTIENQWSVTILEHQINSQLYQQKGKLIHNFDKSLPKNLHKHATDTFKGEYLLDFINLDEQDDERVFENEIVKNIKNFIMSLGNDFAYMGNQYRVMIEEEEFFIDLLFFHRTLQSLVAFELKRGKFKAEYAGKMNLYLSALDEYVKRKHENPSIGIILCKEKTDKVVEFAFRDYNKAMGVAIFKTSRQIPDKYKGLLPDTDELKKLL